LYIFCFVVWNKLNENLPLPLPSVQAVSYSNNLSGGGDMHFCTGGFFISTGFVFFTSEDPKSSSTRNFREILYRGS